MGESVLRVVHLQKVFPSGRGLVHAVNDISFEVIRGETFALVGESGSGKTTVGRCLLRLIQPTAGEVYFADQDITSMSPGRFRTLRHKMQMVFQEPHASLNPRLRVASIVEDPLLFGPPLRKEDRRDRVVEVLSEVGLGSSYVERYPHQLTGSEAQRVGIARAIVTSPDLVILDEPTSYLDISARAEIIDLLRRLQERLRVTYLFISHDLTAVNAIADRVAVMYLGKIVETGTTEVMFSSQRHPYTRALLSATLFPDPTRRIPRFQLSGEIPSPMDLPKHCFLAGRCPLVIDRCREQIPPLEEVAPGRMAACIRWKDVASAGDAGAHEKSAHSEVSRQAARGGNN
jgi:oligopeptide/dipeptide ABC transporter ATP-binding protein